METHIKLQDAYRAATTERPRRGIMAPMLKGLAALSATMTIMLALLPSTDVGAVQRSLAVASTSAFA